MYELTIETTFSSAHQLHGYEGQCEHMHGHNWVVQASVRSRELNSIGLVIDFKVLKQLLREIISEIDHRILNEHPDFMTCNPTCEHIARWIFQKLSSRIPNAAIQVSKVTVWEARDAFCAYYQD